MFAQRIISVLFPVFAITAIGYFVARRGKPDMSHANKLTADVFVPALVFGALAGRDFHVIEYKWLALAMLLITMACGVFGFALARALRMPFKTLMPPMMFSNSINLGLPVAVLAFGDRALQPAIILFLISSLLHYSYGVWLLDHHARLSQMWRVPSLVAMVAGFAVSLSGVVVWQPLVMALKMLGDISIPLMLFALGVRLTEVSLKNWHVSLLAGIIRPAVGVLLAYLVAWLLRLEGFEKSLLILYGALPPAVMNYIFAERYHQEPERVASIVMVGNLLTVLILPMALALVL